jgi:gliding motility-associated-like protein
MTIMKKLIISVLLLNVGVYAGFSQNAVRLNSNADVVNTIIYGNTRVKPVSTGVPTSYSAMDTAVPGPGNIRLQSSPFSNGYRINASSPAYNTGTHDGLREFEGTVVDTLDLDYLDRFGHLRCPQIDMGAFEYQVIPTTITVGLPENTSICEGRSFTLSVTAIGTNLTYQWYKNGVVEPGKTSSTWILQGNLSDAGTYQVVVLGDCCSDTATTVVKVDLNTFVQLGLAIMNDTTVNSGASVQLKPQPGDVEGTLTWYEEDLTTVVTNLTITNINRTHHYFAVLTNGACPDPAYATVSIFVRGSDDDPTCRVDARPDTTICQGDPLRLTTGMTTVNYRWIDLQTGDTLPKFAVVWPEVTSKYEVQAFWESGVVCSKDTLTVTVYIVPIVINTGTNGLLDTCGLLGGNILVNLTSTPPADSWHHANGDLIGNGNLTGIMVPSGRTTTFYARLNDGTCTANKPLAIRVNPPDFGPAFTDSTICIGDSIRLAMTVDPIYIIWKYASDGSLVDWPDHSDHPFVKPTVTTVYRAWSYDAVCGDVFMDITVRVVEKPNFEAFDLTICQGRSGTLMSEPNATYWTNINGVRVFNPIVVNSASQYIGWYVLGGCVVSDIANVTVETRPNFSHRMDTTITRGSAVLLWSIPEATDWVIVKEDFHLGVGNHIVQPMDSVTTYIVELVLEACESFVDTVRIYTKDVFDIDVITGPDPNNIDPNFDGCYGEGVAHVKITGTSPPYTIVWSGALIENVNVFNAQPQQTYSLTGLYPGTYNVKVTDAQSRTVDKNFIIRGDSIRISLTLSPSNHKDCNTGKITATVTGGFPLYTYYWGGTQLDDVFPGQPNNHTVHNLTIGRHNVRVVDAKGCSSETVDTLLGCTYSRLRPNRFITPNGDGKNDWIEINGIENYPKNKVTFFNAYGEIVRTIRDYDNKNPNRRFDGRSKSNHQLPDGVYYYILEAEGLDKPMTGWILMKLSNR